MKKTIFDYINSILYKNKILDKIPEDNTEYNQFMINRWLSMYSFDLANIINCTVNVYSGVLDNQMHYDMLYNLIPKCRSKKINYLKNKSLKPKEDLEIKDLSEINELSYSEIKENFDIVYG